MKMASFFAIFFVCAIAVDAELTNDEKQAILVAHNMLREAASPPAAAMLYLSWNSALEAKAQDSANACELYRHASVVNTELGHSAHLSVSRQLQGWEVTKSWYAQKRGFYGTGGEDACLDIFGACDGYLQMMFDDMSGVGCAHKLCGTAHYVHCVYSGKVRTSGLPYAVGEPCSKCPSSAPRCLNGLCVTLGIVDKPETKLYDATVSRENTVCKLDCHNCGELVNRENDCKCHCHNGGKPANGATAQSCRCQCANNDFYGQHCMVPKDVRDNSVIVTLTTGDGTSRPVPLSLFKSTAWPVMKIAISSALFDYCRSNQENFDFCCEGKSLQETLSKSGGNSDSSNIHGESVTHSLDLADRYPNGDLSVAIQVKVNSSLSDSYLCYSTEADASNMKKKSGTEIFVPSSLIRDAIVKYKSRINIALKSCCQDVVIKSATIPGVQMSRSPSAVNKAKLWLFVLVWLFYRAIFATP